jgi:hypothetical protein
MSLKLRAAGVGAIAAALAAWAIAPARADDCSAVKNAMLAAARTPHTTTITRVVDGKPVTARMVQTKDTRYFEIRGAWRSMPFSADEVRDMEESLNGSQLTCARVGADRLAGKSVMVYTAHIKNEDTEGDAKLWLGSDGLPLQVDNVHDGQRVSSSLDYTHADAPAGATPLNKP